MYVCMYKYIPVHTAEVLRNLEMLYEENEQLH
jgi:hypothetical protein